MCTLHTDATDEMDLQHETAIEVKLHETATKLWRSPTLSILRGLYWRHLTVTLALP